MVLFKIYFFLQSSLQRHNTPHPKDLRSWRNKMAKKYQTDGNLLHHDHQHPYQPNAHTHTDSSHPSISSATSTAHQNRMGSDAGMHARSSVDYIPPELSLDDHRDSDDVCETMSMSSLCTFLRLFRMNMMRNPVNIWLTLKNM